MALRRLAQACLTAARIEVKRDLVASEQQGKKKERNVLDQIRMCVAK